MTYAARTHYEDAQVVGSYEVVRFSGWLGRRRRAAEQAALARIFDLLPHSSSVLDCPVGNGRWAEQLRRRGHRVTGADVSLPMLRAAAGRLADPAGPPGPAAAPLLRTSAERLGVADRSFDVVFSHALTKHLPPDVQDRVFGELARVARSHLVCSFTVLSGARGLLWRLRRLEDAYGRTWPDLRLLAAANGFGIEAAFACTTAVGTEQTVLFRRR